MKRMRILPVLVVLGVLFTQSVSASVTAPTDTFTHWGDKSIVTRSVYEATKVVTSRSLGLKDDIGVIEDIDCDEDGNTYILTDSSRIICFDSDYKLVRDYEIVDESGKSVDFSGAKGIYINTKTEIYIADSKNGRVLRCVDSIVKQEITLPKSSLIPSDFIFQPTKITKDSKGYLFVISDGSYYGAVLYDPSGAFSGFYGANTVKGNVLTTLSYFWDRLTMNDIKRAKTRKEIPYQFTDICIDASGFVYTSTSISAGDATGQVRMLSPGGTNILTGANDFNFGESKLAKRLNAYVQQNFIGIQADGRGFIYTLDKAYGLIYIYDTNRNMIAAFGGGRGQGRQAGVFSSACSIALSGSRLMVADSLRNSVTVFERTDYGTLLLNAQELTMKADYINAKPLWEKVLQKDSLNHLALTGLAKAAFIEGDYQLTMDYAKKGGDVSAYSQALQEVQNKFISNNFVWIFLLAIFLLASLIVLLIIKKKRQIVLINNVKLNALFSGMIHPFNAFNSIKYKQMGSMRIAIVMSVLFFLTSATAVTWSDFRYTSFNPTTYNSIFQIVQTIGLILLWSVANWGISTLQEGKGRLKEVFIVSAYSTLPLIMYNVVSTPLTHLLASPNSTLISGLHSIALVFTGIMLVIGLMVIHDFSFPRFVFTAFVTVLFMILIIFVLFMAGTLFMQLLSFVGNVILEAVRWQ